MLNNIVLIISILTSLFAFISFWIEVYSGRDVRKALHDRIRSRQPQPSTLSSPINTPPPPASAGVSPPQPPVVPMRTRRRLLPPHPWLFAVSLLNILLIAIIAGVLSPSNDLYSLFTTIFVFVWLATWIFSVVVAVRGRHWVWLPVLILSFGYLVIFFSIFARPKKQVPQPSQGPTAQPAPAPVSQTPNLAGLRCPHCSIDLIHLSRYCPHCGNPLKTS